ncbi:MAG: hypothetical protein Q9170_001114 [Blastenia crenularia]
MDRSIAHNAILRVNAYRHIRQRATRLIRSRSNATPKTARKGSGLSLDQHQRHLPFPNKYLTRHGRPQQESPALRFRLLTDSINKNLSPSDKDLQAWVQDFLSLGSLQLLRVYDCNEAIRILHNLDRKYSSNKNEDGRKKLEKLVELVRQALQSNSLPSTSHGSLHLLSYYKESRQYDKGLEFWNWLSGTNEAALNPLYVGAAIELLAVYGAGIDYCEDVYERTLAQQGDISSQYYFTPGAILPDRSKAIMIRGTSSGLLQGIISARLSYGKWQRAYLSLDTAFMLRPTQIVPRVLDLFVFERPIFEAISVFFMHCRGGNPVPEVTFSAILNSLKGLAGSLNDYNTKVRLIRTIFSVLEAYIGSGGSVNTIHLNIITAAVCSVIPSESVMTPVNILEGSKHLRNVIVDLFARLFGFFICRSVSPNLVTFGEVISQALHFGHFDVAKVAASDMLALGIVPKYSTATDMLKTAALLKDPQLLKTAWACIREISSARQGNTPKPQVWKSLTAAAQACGLESFVEDELQCLAPKNLLQARSAVQSVDETTAKHFYATQLKQDCLDGDQVHAFHHLCTEIDHSLNHVEDIQSGKFRDLLQYPINEPTTFKWPEVAEESWQRKLYDELTVEKGQKEPDLRSLSGDQSEDTIPAVSDTGVPFDELRYSNWKTINNLLIQAEAWERRSAASTDAAIKRKQASFQQKNPAGSSGPSAARYLPWMEQFKTFQQNNQDEQATHWTEDAWRRRIFRLRDTNYEFHADTSTVSLL